MRSLSVFAPGWLSNQRIWYRNSRQKKMITLQASGSFLVACRNNCVVNRNRHRSPLGQSMTISHEGVPYEPAALHRPRPLLPFNLEGS